MVEGGVIQQRGRVSVAYMAVRSLRTMWERLVAVTARRELAQVEGGGLLGVGEVEDEKCIQEGFRMERRCWARGEDGPGEVHCTEGLLEGWVGGN